MEAIKKKMEMLRLEADESADKMESLKEQVKALKQENLSKEQEIASLTHRNQMLEGEIEKLENMIVIANESANEGSEHSNQKESLAKKLQILEEEAEQADRILKETYDKLRQTDIKAGHYERKMQALEAERDQWETKYEEMASKYTQTKSELEGFTLELNNI